MCQRSPRPRVKVGHDRHRLRGDGDGNAAKRAFEIAENGGDTVWRSVDVDCVDTAFVPGSGWQEPGGSFRVKC